MASTKLRRLGGLDALIVVLANPGFDEALREGFDEVKRRGTGGGKITHICVVRPLTESDIVNDLRDDPVEVHIALAVGMGRDIEGYPIDKTGEIRAMVQIETAQKILMGFPGATVRGHDHTGHDFQDFAWTERVPAVV